MKYLIASDLHGSYHYGELLIDRFIKEKADLIILLGDLLYHGARNSLPDEYDTIALTRLLNGYKESVFAVRGNCDSEVDQMVLEFPIMADYNQMYVDGRQWILTHGHLFDEHSMVPHRKGAVLLHGHTHVKVMEKCSDFYYMNPGSVSIPKDDGTHSYMIYENGVFTLKDVEDGREIRSFKLA